MIAHWLLAWAGYLALAACCFLFVIAVCALVVELADRWGRKKRR